MVLTKEAYQTQRKPMIAFQDLANRDRWPKAESVTCCMFEAIDIVGKALFGPLWTGKELLALDWPFQPSEAEAHHKLTSARYLKTTTERGFKRELPTPVERSPIEHVLAWRRHRAPIERAARVEAEQSLWEANRILADRLAMVVEWIAARCRDNMLASFCRLTSGGKLMPMVAHEWNCEEPIERFLAKGSYHRWFAVEPVRQLEVYVFFDRAKLQQAIADLAHAPVMIPVQDIDRLSPYLKLAVKLAIAKGYFSDAHDETQAIREAEVNAAWADALPDVPWSKTSVETIAKVMGFPNSKAIKQGQRARAREK